MIKLEQRGDTLVEVLFATVVLSIVLAGAFTLSNRATKINQEAFERTQVSNFLQEQVELARAARDSFDAQDIGAPESSAWNAITSNEKPTVDNLGTVCEDFSILSTALTARSAFYMDSSSGSIAVTNGFTVQNDIFNIWLEASDGDGYTDIHAFACWDGLNADVAQRTSVIVRLEDPS